MPFHDMRRTGGIKSRASQAHPNEVFIALYRTGKTNSSLTVSIRLGGRVMDALGWKRGDFVVTFEGEGKDGGRLQVVKTSDATGRRLTDPSGLVNDPDAARLYILAKAFSNHEMPSEKQTGTACEYAIEDGKLTIKLPKWAEPISAKPEKSLPASALVKTERKSLPTPAKRRGSQQ